MINKQSTISGYNEFHIFHFFFLSLCASRLDDHVYFMKTQWETVGLYKRDKANGWKSFKPKKKNTLRSAWWKHLANGFQLEEDSIHFFSSFAYPVVKHWINQSDVQRIIKNQLLELVFFFCCLVFTEYFKTQVRAL